VLVMFVTVDGEVNAMKIFRRAQNFINWGLEKENKGNYKKFE
jgi:hypothetical protein